MSVEESGQSTRVPTPALSSTMADMEKGKVDQNDDSNDLTINEKRPRASSSKQTPSPEPRTKSEKDSEDDIIVDWDSPEDPNNPKKCVLDLIIDFEY